MIEVHQPLIMGVLEANMGENCFKGALEIDGYKLERGNLTESGIRTRTAVYIQDQLNYLRRKDLETPRLRTIWLEINPKSKKS